MNPESSFYNDPQPQHRSLLVSCMGRKVWWCLVGFSVLCHNWHVDNLNGYRANFDVWYHWMWPSLLPTLALIAPTQLIALSNIIDFLHLVHSTCTQKPTKHHQTIPSPCWYWKRSMLGLVGSGLWDFMEWIGKGLIVHGCTWFRTAKRAKVPGNLPYVSS